MAKNEIDVKLTNRFNDRLQQSQAYKKALAALESSKPFTVSSTEGTTTTWPTWTFGGNTGTTTTTTPFTASGGTVFPSGGTVFPSVYTLGTTWSPFVFEDYDPIITPIKQDLIDEVVADQIRRHN